MKHKCLRLAGLVFALFLIAGCSKQAPQPGDTLIPPVPASPLQNNTVSRNSLSNMSNMSPLALPSSNMVYSLLDKAEAPLSIFADNKYLYLLRCSDSIAATGDTTNQVSQKYGTGIDVYDVENASLIRKITDETLDMCSAFTVKDSNLYAFDVKTGRILLFSSSGGFLSAYDTGLAGVYAEKLAVTRNRRMIMKIREKNEAASKLAIYNMDTKAVSIVDVGQLFPCPPDPVSKISDFCLYGESSILVGISPGSLCLFDVEGTIPKKSCIFPMSAGYMEFDGNVLYYSSDGLVSLSPGNTANFSNISSRRLTGRVLINSEFPWPETMEELGMWLLNDLHVPYAKDNGRHYGMAQNSKYLFFLDFIPAQPNGNDPADSDFMVYRIMK
jgi:hypothetical protein